MAADKANEGIVRVRPQPTLLCAVRLGGRVPVRVRGHAVAIMEDGIGATTSRAEAHPGPDYRHAAELRLLPEALSKCGSVSDTKDKVPNLEPEFGRRRIKMDSPRFHQNRPLAPATFTSCGARTTTTARSRSSR